MKGIHITGMGIISAVGNNLTENLESLRQSKSGVGRSRYFDSKFAESYPFGEVGLSTEELKKNVGLPDTKGFTRTDFLACLAFKEAVKNAGLPEDILTSPDTGFISSTTVGGMCLTDKAYMDANKKVEKSEFCESYSNGRHLLNIVKSYGLKGYTDCINTACSSSANTIMLGARLIRSGRIKRAIVGGVDSLAKFTANGFNSLQILSSEPCKPFDKMRQGLNLGEGAAYIVLEAHPEDREVLADLKGWGNNSDAHHASALSDEAFGPTMAIENALKTAQIPGDKIDYVNAHGTATENNDICELTAIQKALGKIPPISSTKAFTGHTLGAAGAIEAVYSILSLTNKELYPNLNCNEPMEEATENLVRDFYSDHDIKTVLSNSFGFAGNCSSLIFCKR